MQIALILSVFALAILSQTGTRVLGSPLIVCTIVGAVLGNVTTGIGIGAIAEIYYIANAKNYGGATPFLAVAVYLSVKLGEGAYESVLQASGIVTALALDGICRLLLTTLLPSARKTAEIGKGKKLGSINIAGALVRGIIAAVYVAVLTANQDSVLSLLEMITTNYVFITRGIAIAASLVKYVGLAVVLRNLELKDMYAVFFAGTACGAMFVGANAIYTIAGSAMIAIAIAVYDYRHSVSNPEKTSTVNSNKGGAEKWW